MRSVGAATKLQPGRWFAAVQLGFGAFVALGSCGELIMALAPGVLPAEVVTEYARLHPSAVVRGWVLAQNLVTLPLGVGMAIAGVGLWRGTGRAVALTGRCARAMLAVCLLGQLVLAVFLYPDLLAGRVVEDGAAMFAVLLGAGLGAMIWPAIAVVVVRHGADSR